MFDLNALTILSEKLYITISLVLKFSVDLIQIQNQGLLVPFQVGKTINVHTHDASALSVEVIKVKTAVKRRAVDTMEQPGQLTAQELCAANSLTLTSIKRNSLKRLVQRTRKNTEAPPPNSILLQQLTISHRFTVFKPISESGTV